MLKEALATETIDLDAISKDYANVSIPVRSLMIIFLYRLIQWDIGDQRWHLEAMGSLLRDCLTPTAALGTRSRDFLQQPNLFERVVETKSSHCFC